VRGTPIEFATIDYHTAGEPFRIVLEGVPEIPGASVAERRERAAADEQVDFARRLLCHEPRGHADMYGCFLVPPDDDDADLGVLFWHKDGYSTACGHGTIALGAWAVESGRVIAAPDGETEVTIDVPPGACSRARACATRASSRCRSATSRPTCSRVGCRWTPREAGSPSMSRTEAPSTRRWTRARRGSPSKRAR
jgi:proline racemase